jgi:hypothetical protein
MVMKCLKLIIFMGLVILATANSTKIQADDQPQANKYTPQQLDQLLAPIALYPDSLLTQILIASTYPIEIVDADRWLQQNKKLKGDKLQAALDQQSWDPSVKALVALPNVLDMMNNKLDWTQNLGDAFLAQQKDVMNEVQVLRKKAMDAGALQSNQQQQVKTDGNVIIVQPANPQVIYVPTYDPTVVYGPWMYPGYPPYPLYPPPPPGAAMFAFSVGFAVGMAWGPTPNWHGGTVIVNNQTYNHYGPYNPRPGPGPNPPNQQWHPGAGPQPQNNNGLLQQHDPGHRQGVPYSDPSTRNTYSPTDSSAVDNRSGYRGYDDSGDKGSDSAFNGADRGTSAQRDSDRGFQSMHSSGFGGGGYRPSGGRVGGGGFGRFR